MSLFVTVQNSIGEDKIKIDMEELVSRLRSLTECESEVVKLAIMSMLDEIEDTAGVKKDLEVV